MFTVQRLMDNDALRERGLHEFDAWASTFGDTSSKLELQPSGKYRPVTRVAEFVSLDACTPPMATINTPSPPDS